MSVSLSICSLRTLLTLLSAGHQRFCVELLTAAGSPPLAAPFASALSPECKEFLGLRFSKDFGMRLTASTIFLVHPFVTRYSTKAGFDATGELSSQTSAAHLTAELPPLTSPSAEDTNETNWHKNVVVCATGEAEDNAKQWPSQSCGQQQQQHCSRPTSVGKACVLEGYIGGNTNCW